MCNILNINMVIVFINIFSENFQKNARGKKKCCTFAPLN